MRIRAAAARAGVFLCAISAPRRPTLPDSSRDWGRQLKRGSTTSVASTRLIKSRVSIAQGQRNVVARRTQPTKQEAAASLVEVLSKPE
jgi:hypothetical protein